jgi:hypothetical protein
MNEQSDNLNDPIMIVEIPNLNPRLTQKNSFRTDKNTIDKQKKFWYISISNESNESIRFHRDI